MGIPPIEPCTLAVSGHEENNLPVSIHCRPSQFMNSARMLSNLQYRCRSRRALSDPRHQIRHH